MPKTHTSIHISGDWVNCQGKQPCHFHIASLLNGDQILNEVLLSFNISPLLESVHCPGSKLEITKMVSLWENGRKTWNFSKILCSIFQMLISQFWAFLFEQVCFKKILNVSKLIIVSTLKFLLGVTDNNCYKLPLLINDGSSTSSSMHSTGGLEIQLTIFDIFIYQ